MKDIEKKINTILKLLESVYHKNASVITKKNQKLTKEEKKAHLVSFFEPHDLYVYFKNQINLPKLMNLIENNPQIKGVKLYALVFELLKPHLDDELNEKLIQKFKQWTQVDPKFTERIKVEQEFKEIIKEATKTLKETTTNELKETIKKIKGWEKLRDISGVRYIYNQLTKDILIEDDLISNELWSTYDEINHSNPYKNPRYFTSFKKDENIIKKWEDLIMSKHPKSLSEYEIKKHCLEEFKKNANSRKEDFLNELTNNDLFKKEYLDHIKETYCGILDKVNALEINTTKSQDKSIYIINMEKKLNKKSKEVRR